MARSNRIIGRNGYIGSTLTDLPEVGATILLAGHSSVKMCENDPYGAWVNNVDFFLSILRDIKPGQKFIYASSASVYDGVERPNEDCNQFNLKGMYDLTKRTIDDLARLSDVEFYGLRFATVNGYSSNLRTDVMLNKMVFDAKTKGEVTIQNPQLVRPILGIRDLKRAICTILKNGDWRGIYNLASFESSVAEMANFVGDYFDVPVVTGTTDKPPYAFGLDTKKFERTYSFEFEDTLESVVSSMSLGYERVGIRE